MVEFCSYSNYFRKFYEVPLNMFHFLDAHDWKKRKQNKREKEKWYKRVESQWNLRLYIEKIIVSLRSSINPMPHARISSNKEQYYFLIINSFVLLIVFSQKHTHVQFYVWMPFFDLAYRDEKAKFGCPFRSNRGWFGIFGWLITLNECRWLWDGKQGSIFYREIINCWVSKKEFKDYEKTYQRLREDIWEFIFLFLKGRLHVSFLIYVILSFLFLLNL